MADKIKNTITAHEPTNETTNEQELFSFAEYHPEEAEKIGYSQYSYWRSVWRNFIKNKVAVAMGIIFILMFIFTFIASTIGRFKYTELRPDSSLSFILPNTTYWFGTDNLGRDYWSQVWYATQTSIKLAAIVGIGELFLGVVAGLVWGYVRSLDRFFTEVYNVISNIPTIIAMTLVALLLGQSFTVMAISLIGLSWIYPARNIRNLVFIYRDREYNLASRCLGTKLWRILMKNILPYLVSVIILRMALSIPQTIAYESTLSYLGLGLDINTPSLGILLRNARSWFLDYPYLLLFPAIIVSLITVTFYLGGNAFADASDPRNHL